MHNTDNAGSNNPIIFYQNRLNVCPNFIIVTYLLNQLFYLRFLCFCLSIIYICEIYFIKKVRSQHDKVRPENHEKHHFFLSFLIVFPSVICAQNGSIKVYSEIKNLEIYLDEVFRGIDIIVIDSVPAGPHYLKAMTQDAIVFGEIINVQAGISNAVLIKNTEEVQKKIQQAKEENQKQLLIDKAAEIEEYKSQRIYIEPIFNQYKQLISWRFRLGKDSIISHLEFANLINDQERINEINAYNASIKPKRALKSFLGVIGLGIAA